MAEGVYGLVAEFDDPDRLIEAARRARESGYRRMDAYTPFPVHGLLEALGKRPTRLQWIVFIAAVLGGVGGYYLQYWIAAVDYPINVGGKPLNSWPNFIPVTFEMAVLVSAIVAAVVMFALNGLPQPYHPLFKVERFQRASQDRFFLCIEAEDPRFDLEETRRFLESLNPLSVEVVEP
ncbi:MAG: membrane protein [Candidatus Poribacteria bacterium]|nr:MAG: membrane protein [Candidatus Poribacteria bacterium]